MLRLRPITNDAVPQLVNWAEETKNKEFFRRYPSLMEWCDVTLALQVFATSYLLCEDARIVGLVNFGTNDPYSRSIEFGLLIDYTANRDISNVTVESTDKVADYVFNNLHYNRLTCRILASRDKLSQRLEKFGFKKEALLEQSACINGEFHNEFLYALTKERYKEKKNGCISSSIRTSIGRRRSPDRRSPC